MHIISVKKSYPQNDTPMAWACYPQVCEYIHIDCESYVKRSTKSLTF